MIKSEMEVRKIVVAPYNPVWKNEFEQIKSELSCALSDLVISIEHVGSTSVPGLYAKPIIDIDIVIEIDSIKTNLISWNIIYMYATRLLMN